MTWPETPHLTCLESHTHPQVPGGLHYLLQPRPTLLSWAKTRAPPSCGGVGLGAQTSNFSHGGAKASEKGLLPVHGVLGWGVRTQNRLASLPSN